MKIITVPFVPPAPENDENLPAFKTKNVSKIPKKSRVFMPTSRPRYMIDPGPIAMIFTNLSSESCYANAPVQALLNCHQVNNRLKEVFVNYATHPTTDDLPLLTEYCRIIDRYADPQQPQIVSIDDLRKAMHTDYWPGTGQHTAMGFLDNLFGSLVSMRELFTYTELTHSKCTVCQTERHNARPAVQLYCQSFNIPQEGTVTWREFVRPVVRLESSRCRHCLRLRGMIDAHLDHLDTNAMAAIEFEKSNGQQLHEVTYEYQMSNTQQYFVCQFALRDEQGRRRHGGITHMHENAAVFPMFGTQKWRLKSVVVHIDHGSTAAGHYYTWVKITNDRWHKLNCTPTEAQAYLLPEPKFEHWRDISHMIFEKAE
jgi:hypothetical protein